MTILFISRKYPPMVGGMENYAYNMHKQFLKHHKVIDIILTKSQIHLIWFFPWVFMYGTFLILTKKIDIVYIGDGLLSSVAFYFQNILKKRVILTVYGLDVIYDKFIYQNMIRLFLPKLESIVSISQATQVEAFKRGVHKYNCRVIPVGIDSKSVVSLDYESSRKELEEKYKINLENKTVLFTIGRLVKRKGVFWFIENVIPKLSDKYIYLVAGVGNEKDKIEKLILEKQLQNKVILFGKVSDKDKRLLFSISDVFLTPNITVKNDMEGFGIVNLEAGLYGIPVVASDIEGIKDAVVNNMTGLLIPEKDVEAYINAIYHVKSMDKSSIQTYVSEKFSWEYIYNQYMKLIKEMI